MADKTNRYPGDGIIVTFEARRCIHARECVHGLPAAFDPKRRPWVDAKSATAAEFARVIERCPTGALHYERTDGGLQEAAPARNTVRVAADGPLYLRGRVRVEDADGRAVVEDLRLALCRCGKSALKPFCDLSHAKAGFKDAGAVPKPEVEAATDRPADGMLVVGCSANGPLAVAGDFDLLDAAGRVVASGSAAWLCRCGGSANKPFCDGTHRKIGFKA